MSPSATRLRLDAGDAAFLERTLPRLAKTGEEHEPVTVDVGKQPVVRVKPEDQPKTTELLLAKSESSGRPLRFRVNRHFLLRAVRLGFRELLIQEPSKPVLFQDERRKYVVIDIVQETFLDAYRAPSLLSWTSRSTAL
jgi:hypothetical protein